LQNLCATGIKTTGDDKENIKSSVERSLKSGQKTEQTIDRTAALLIVGLVMKDSRQSVDVSDANPNWITLEREFYAVGGYYDLSSGVSAQQVWICGEKWNRS